MGRTKTAAICVLAMALSALLIAGPVTAARNYKVTKGDSLWTIARKFSTHVSSIKQANHLTDSKPLQIGQVLIIPAASPTKPSTSPTGSAVKVKGYKVSEGDSLWTVARKLRTSVRDLKQANRITDDKPLQIGQVLALPKGVVLPPAVKRQASKPRLHHKRLAQRPTHQITTRHYASSGRRPLTQVANAGISGDVHSRVVRRALAYRGVRYRRGGTSAGGFDCSGFTRYIYSKSGVRLPHSSAAQAHLGKRVPKSQLKPGDLVFFRTYRRGVSHVGIYMGNGKFVHSSNHSGGVRTDSLGSAYYHSRYVSARRVR